MGELPDDKFANASERPAHSVQVAAFALGVYPVTNEQFRAFDPKLEPTDESNHPVVRVSWHRAVEYCRWLSESADKFYRLPSEAEWEYAAAAGKRAAYPRGSDLNPTDANYYYTEHGHRVGPGHLTSVQTYPANVFGLHDLHGNVCEWTADHWHRTYDGAPTSSVAWTTDGDSSRRVIRGGAWDHLPRLLRTTHRDALPPDTRADNLGFRVALTPA